MTVSVFSYSLTLATLLPFPALPVREGSGPSATPGWRTIIEMNSKGKSDSAACKTWRGLALLSGVRVHGGKAQIIGLYRLACSGPFKVTRQGTIECGEPAVALAERSKRGLGSLH